MDHSLHLGVRAQRKQGIAPGLALLIALMFLNIVSCVEESKAAEDNKIRRFDIVFVIDSTLSMGKWFPPIKEAIADFVNAVKSDVGSSGRSIEDTLRAGLLFFQDRKIGRECKLDYITEWRVQLTEKSGFETVNETLVGLLIEQEAKCPSDEEEEAVYDGLNRAIADPQWRAGSLRTIVMISDSLPHPASNIEKNPMRFDRAAIAKLADEKSVRFITVLIKRDPGEDLSELEKLAIDRPAGFKGRFVAVPPVAAKLRASLGQSLIAEWRNILVSTQN